MALGYNLAKKYIFSFIWLVLWLGLILGPKGLLATDHCEIPFDAIEKHAQSLYRNRQVYKCGFCFLNSGELGKNLVKTFGNNIDRKKLKILVFRNKHHEMDQRVASEHTVVSNDEFSRNGKSNIWNYHAVVEYKGRIMDFDKKEGWVPTPIYEYLEQMLPPFDGKVVSIGKSKKTVMTSEFNGDDMEITAIPIDEYLNRFGAGRPNPREIDVSFVDDYPRWKISDYLSKQ